MLRGIGYSAVRQSWLFMAGDDHARHGSELLDGDARIILIFSPSSIRSPFYQRFASTVLGDERGRVRTAVFEVEGAQVPGALGVAPDGNLRGEFSGDAEARDYLLARLADKGMAHGTVPAQLPARGISRHDLVDNRF